MGLAANAGGNFSANWMIVTQLLCHSARFELDDKHFYFNEVQDKRRQLLRWEPSPAPIGVGLGVCRA